MAKKFNEVRVPFDKMTFSPDVPATALGANEYNAGRNVETDVRGVRSMAGDNPIFESVPGTPNYVSGGFRADGKFWFIVACDDAKWYANDGDGSGWEDITPPGITGSYAQNLNITEAWNGTVPFFNDTINPPMVWLDGDATMTLYSNRLPLKVTNISYVNPTTQRITLQTPQPSAPYAAGEKIVITDAGNLFNGTFTVVSSTTTTIDYLDVPGGSYTPGDVATVSPLYAWNYNTNWKSYSATFLRIFSTPNVGSILIAGNLTAINQNDEVERYPVTVQWSQAFGLNSAPITWQPTINNVANQLEVPLRGPAIDGFPSNGQFFLSSYWDTVVFSPINYSTTSAPILGVRIYNQGRGMLTSNAWANTDKSVYGIDSRDIWVFNGQDFQGIGNQRVKNWFFDNLNLDYVDRLFMEVNTQKNQVEIYFADYNVPTTGPVAGVPNRMLSYRYDLDCWNAPRDVDAATFACESPVYVNATDSSLPEWVPNYGSRTITYVRGEANGVLVQKDQGFNWYDGDPIESSFVRDNIKLLPEYSGKLLVHRLLPEVVNMGAQPDSFYDDLPIDPADPALQDNKGNVTITVGGANSVGQAPQEKTPVTMAIDTDNPWIQVNQNAFRVNRIEIENVSNSSIWMCSATTWQYTQTEDDR